MPDVLYADPISLEAYQEFVQTERQPNEIISDKWDNQRAWRLTGELVELLEQHGPGFLLLSHVPARAEEAAITYPSLRDAVADEVGDILWFDFDIAAHHHRSPSELCVKALQARVAEALPAVTTFTDLQNQVMNHASEIKVANRLKFMGIGIPDRDKETSLTEDPLEVLDRLGMRLLRALKREDGKSVYVDPLDEDFDLGLDQALGDHINAMIYIAKVRLGWNIEDVARYNVYKLRHRKQFGKSEARLE